VAYATAVKSIPAVLASSRFYGLDKYPDFYTVNSAEATQIMDAAGDILRYMAEGPLSIAQPFPKLKIVINHCFDSFGRIGLPSVRTGEFAGTGETSMMWCGSYQSF
jgi:dihydroorotase